MAVNSIEKVSGLSSAGLFGTDKIKNGSGDNAISFSDFLKEAVNKTNDLLIESEKISEDFAAGKTDNIHQVLIAVEKADTALQFTMQIRNKVMEAYNEIMRMQI